MTDEERAKRIYHHTYVTCEGIQEHAERIVALEELVAGLFAYARLRAIGACECDGCMYRERCTAEDPDSCLAIEWFEHDMRELGIGSCDD